MYKWRDHWAIENINQGVEQIIRVEKGAGNEVIMIGWNRLGHQIIRVEYKSEKECRNTLL